MLASDIGPQLLQFEMVANSALADTYMNHVMIVSGIDSALKKHFRRGLHSASSFSS